MKRTARMLALLAGALSLVAQPIAAQQRLPPWTQVRVALPRGELVEGRLIGGDASSLTVQTDAGAAVTVQRDRILLLTASFIKTPRQVTQAAILAGAIGTVLAGSASTSCGGPRDCGPTGAAIVGGAALGGLAGSAIAQARAPSELGWRAVPASVVVSNRTSGFGSPESCRRSPTLQADLGLSTAGSQAGRLSATISCYRGMAVGGEIGWPRHLSSRTSSYGTAMTSYTFTARERKHEADFVGMFAEHAVPGPLNPRVIWSLGTYRRSDQVITVSHGGFSGSFGIPAETRSEQSVTTTHSGFGVGFAMSTPATAYLSFGVEGRTHRLLGEGGGSISTIAATIRLRP